MRLQRLLLLAAVAAGATACQKDAGPFTPTAVPLAYIRYVQAVPDTTAMDFRFVDQVENSPWFGQMNFRTITNYQGAAAGSRHIKIFSYPAGSTDITLVTNVILDTTITLEANKYYTILHSGFARAGSTPRAGLKIFVDDRATPSGSQIGVKVYNAAAGMGNVDVYTTASSSASLPSAPLAANVGFAASSAYSLMNTGALFLRVTNNGSTTELTSAAGAPAGAPPVTISQSAAAGYSIGGSLLSAFVFPKTVTGSPATNFATPAVVWTQDNHPQMP